MSMLKKSLYGLAGLTLLMAGQVMALPETYGSSSMPTVLPPPVEPEPDPWIPKKVYFDISEWMIPTPGGTRWKLDFEVIYNTSVYHWNGPQCWGDADRKFTMALEIGDFQEFHGDTIFQKLADVPLTNATKFDDTYTHAIVNFCGNMILTGESQTAIQARIPNKKIWHARLKISAPITTPEGEDITVDHYSPIYQVGGFAHW